MADLTFSIASDTTAFDNGIRRGVIEPLEDADKALEDLGRTGDRELGDLEDAMSDARRDTERFEDEIKDVSDELTRVGRAGKRAADDIGDSFNRSSDRMRKQSAEVGQEIRQNLGEGIANAARGDFEGLSDTIGDTLGGAVAGIGGVATAGIAAAGALGLGAIVGTISTIASDAEKLKETVSENFREMAENGIDAWESLQSQNQRLTEAYDQHVDEINRIKDLVGLNFETVAAAWAGNKDAVDQVTAAYAQTKSELRDTMGVSSEAAQATIRGWDGIMGPLTNTLEGYDQAKEKAGQLEAQITGGEQAQREEISRTNAASQARWEAEAARVDAVSAKVNALTAPKTINVKVNPDTTNLDALERRLNALDNSSVTIRVNDDGTIGRFWK